MTETGFGQCDALQTLLFNSAVKKVARNEAKKVGAINAVNTSSDEQSFFSDGNVPEHELNEIWKYFQKN